MMGKTMMHRKTKTGYTVRPADFSVLLSLIIVVPL